MKVVNHSSGLRGVGIWRQGNRAYWRCRVQSKLMWFSKLFPFTENGKLKAAKMYYDITQKLYKDRTYEKKM
jgi:hypothetical protein